MTVAGLIWSLPHHHTIIIRKEGRLICNVRSSEGHEPIYSMTKSVVSTLLPLASKKKYQDVIGKKIHRLFPDQEMSIPRSIKLSHILDQSTGIVQSTPWKKDFERKNDFVEIALRSDFDEGKIGEFSYSNKAVNILSAFVRIESGKSLKDIFCNELKRLKIPLDFEWETDKAKNILVHGGLNMDPVDLTLYFHRLITSPNIYNKNILNFILNRQGIEERHSLLWWRRKDYKLVYAKGEMNNYLLVFPQRDLIVYLSSSSNDKKLVDIDQVIKELDSI